MRLRDHSTIGADHDATGGGMRLRQAGRGVRELSCPRQEPQIPICEHRTARIGAARHGIASSLQTKGRQKRCRNDNTTGGRGEQAVALTSERATRRRTGQRCIDFRAQPALMSGG